MPENKFNFQSQRNIPGINSSVAADVSFLLLIFFILTVSINPCRVIAVHLSSAAPAGRETNHIQIKERDFLPIYIDSDNRIFCRAAEITKEALKPYAKRFIDNPGHEGHLPEKIPVNIPLLGKMEVTKNHIIALSNDDRATFQTYIFVQNEILAAYSELRDELAMKRFGKPCRALPPAQQTAVKACYQRQISRPESAAEGGRL
jgi:biopolymer transport protein ExbD